MSAALSPLHKHNLMVVIFSFGYNLQPNSNVKSLVCEWRSHFLGEFEQTLN